MKDKTAPNTKKCSSDHNSLWRELPIKQLNSPVKSIKKKGRISDFLKNVHTSQDPYYEASQSDVLSVMDIKYSQCSSNDGDFKEKRYFAQLLLNALKQIWTQLYEQAHKLRKESKQILKKVEESFMGIMQDKLMQINRLREEIQTLENCNQALKSENKNLGQKLKKYDAENSTDLIQTNKQLRIYLKNMNQIMMSYHAKNIQLEESLRQMEAKYQAALKSESTNFQIKSAPFIKDQSLDGTYFTPTLTRFSQIKTEYQDQNESYREQHSVQFPTRNNFSSPQSLTRKRFCRKANIYSPAPTVRYPPNRIYEQNEDSNQISDQQSSLNKNSLKESLRRRSKNGENTNKVAFLRLSLS